MQKHYPRKFTTTLLAAVAALVAFGSQSGMAQTTKTRSGDFRSTDGNSGTYAVTVVENGASRTETVVYTRSSDNKTSTDVTSSVNNGDMTHTVDFSHTDYGSTAQYVSHKTETKVKGGRIGSGTFTDADGTTGTLTSLATSGEGVRSESTTFTSSTGAIRTVLRSEINTAGFVAVKRLVLNPDGSTSASVTTRYVTGL